MRGAGGRRPVAAAGEPLDAAAAVGLGLAVHVELREELAVRLQLGLRLGLQLGLQQGLQLQLHLHLRLHMHMWDLKMGMNLRLLHLQMRLL